MGSDIFQDFLSYASCYGKKFVFIGGKRSLGAARGELEKSFAGDDLCSCSFAECGRIATIAEIDRVSALTEVAEAEVVCAVGGGSCMDVARTIANRSGRPLLMLPTTVASDAPCSCVSVFYDEAGTSVVGDEVFYKCPDMVMVDSKVIANAPKRQIASGMADALATYYEGITCRNHPNGTGITETAMMIAGLCRDIVLRDGFAAYQSVENHIVTPQLENVIEANCFLSGVGGANTGCAAAHGMGDYLCKIPGGHDFMHGERVFVGLVVQMILEQYPVEEIRTILRFGKRMGLPASLADLGVKDIEKTACSLAEGLQGDHFMANLCCDYSVNKLAGSILYAQCLADNLI